MVKFIIAPLVGLLAYSSAFAKEGENDFYQAPPTVAVENRRFTPTHDISLQLGVLPLDAFYKGYLLGVTYTYGWRDYLRWEAVNASYVSSQDTGLKRDLIDNFQVQPKGILDSVKSILSSNLIYTPVYSKNLWFNSSVVYGEFSFVGGAGGVQYTSGQFAPMIGGGLILRYFVSQESSYKFDGRLYYQFAKDQSSDLILMISLAYSYDFGSGDKSRTRGRD